MKRPTVASLKKVTVENLATLGVERLAEILVAVGEVRPEWKRRLRMELAAEQGAEHLTPEIDKRLAALETSRTKVSWRQRASFLRELDGLRQLIAGRLAGLDRWAALNRLWQFLGAYRRVTGRVRDKDGELAATFARAAADLGEHIAKAGDEARAADALAEAIVEHPADWTEWLDAVLDRAPPRLAAATLERVSRASEAPPALVKMIRRLADAAGDVDAYLSTYTAETLRTPSAAAEAARRLLAEGRVAEAGAVLEAARGDTAGRPKLVEPDFDCETAWIDYLDRSGRPDEAQAARWASFERTLSVDRAKAFTSRLSDFNDVEAEQRAFDYAAAHGEFQRGLQFLMDWPALPEAARMILARPDDVRASDAQVELWAAKLRLRQPGAAHALLRKAAAAAFRRRDFATCDRLTHEADAIDI